MNIYLEHRIILIRCKDDIQKLSSEYPKDKLEKILKTFQQFAFNIDTGDVFCGINRKGLLEVTGKIQNEPKGGI